VAFADLRPRDNLKGMLVALCELRSATTGYVLQRRAYGDDWAALLFGAEFGLQVVGGVVDAWEGFGYASDFEQLGNGEVAGDGAFRISTQASAPDAHPLAYFLQINEFVGTRIAIAQCLLDPITGTWSYSVLFRGVVTNLRDYTDSGVTVEVGDIRYAMGLVGTTTVTKALYPNAPEESVGATVPVIYGDHFMTPCIDDPYILRYNRIRFGYEYLGGVPLIKVDTDPQDEDDCGVWAIADHELKVAYDHMLGAADGGLEHLAHPHPDDVTLTNTSTGASVAMTRPFRLSLGLFPSELTTVNTATNSMRAIDGDEATYATLTRSSGAAQYLDFTLGGLPDLGIITGIHVYAWFAAGGSGDVVVGLGEDATYFKSGAYKTVSMSATYDVIDGPEVVTGAGLKAWDLSDYTARVKILDTETATAYIRGLRVLFTYQPYNTSKGASFVASPSSGEPHLWGPGAPDKGDWVKGWAAKTLRTGQSLRAYVRGIKDDGSGTYTGTASALVENAADVAYHLLDTYSGLTVGEDFVATGSAIGSFATARTELGSYHNLTVLVTEPTSTWDVFVDICRQARAVPVVNSDGMLGMVVIDPTPSANYESGYAWRADEDFLSESFRYGRTPVEDAVSSVVIEYAYSYPDGKFRGLTYVNADGSDDGTGTADESGTGDREDQAEVVERLYGPGREFKLQARYIRRQGVAKALRNFYFDNLKRPRLWCEFLTTRKACDLSVGNVTVLADDKINGFWPPNAHRPANGWDDYKWYVTAVTREETPEGVSSYRVRLIEAIEPTTPADWVAADDD
jgi:hypothetical protein